MKRKIFNLFRLLFKQPQVELVKEFQGRDISQQVFFKLRGYDKLINSQYKHIDIFCKASIIKFGCSHYSKSEEGILKYIDELEERKRIILDLVLPLKNSGN